MCRNDVMPMKLTNGALDMDFNDKVCATDTIGVKGLVTLAGDNGIMSVGWNASEVTDPRVAEGPMLTTDINVAAPKGEGPSVVP